MTVFLKSRPFSKFHPFHIGISNISTGFAKKQPFAEFQPFGLDSEKDEITKKQAFAKFQPFATKLSHIHHFPHLHSCEWSSSAMIAEMHLKTWLVCGQNGT
jgi:hypothetical protein